MLSESQERMLLIVEPANLQAVLEVFSKWELDASVVGRVTDDKLLRVRMNGETLAEIPAETLVLEAAPRLRGSKGPERPPILIWAVIPAG